jgi:hypothetical protein
MTSFMLYNNSAMHLNISVQMTGRFFASALFVSALAAAKLDLASLALIPNESGDKYISQDS